MERDSDGACRGVVITVMVGRLCKGIVMPKASSFQLLHVGLYVPVAALVYCAQLHAQDVIEATRPPSVRRSFSILFFNLYLYLGESCPDVLISLIAMCGLALHGADCGSRELRQ